MVNRRSRRAKHKQTQTDEKSFLLQLKQAAKTEKAAAAKQGEFQDDDPDEQLSDVSAFVSHLSSSETDSCYSDSEESTSSSDMDAEPDKSSGRLDVFDGRNFEEWCVRIRWGLMGKGLESLIKDSDEEKKFRAAEVEDRENPEFKKFRRRNGKAVNFIVRRLTSRVIMRVKNCVTAKQMFETLESLYKVSSDVGRDAARLTLFSLRYREGGNMRIYIEKFERAADNYRSMGGELTPEEELEQFRTSLPSNYASVRDWFSLLDKKDKTLQMLKRKCLENYEYSRRDTDAVDRDREAGSGHSLRNFADRGRDVGNVRGFGRGFRNEQNSEPKKDNRECFFCGEIGHLSRNCRMKLQSNYSDGKNYEEKADPEKQQSQVLKKEEADVKQSQEAERRSEYRRPYPARGASSSTRGQWRGSTKPPFSF